MNYYAEPDSDIRNKAKAKVLLDLTNYSTLIHLIWLLKMMLLLWKPKLTKLRRRQFTFHHQVPRNFLYSFYRPWKDERLSQHWSHPVVLNTEPLDWESSNLTTTPLLHIAKLVNIATSLNNLKRKVDDLDVGKLKTVLVDLKIVSDKVDNVVV